VSPYDVDFDWDGAHGRLVALLSDRVEPGLVIDLGCGYAPHASALEAAGFTYVGFDVDDTAVAAVRERGHSASVLDLGDVEAVIAALRSVVADSDRELASVVAIEVIEHLLAPQVLLAELSTWMDQTGSGVLGVSVPNVAHRDLAAKLLVGRWDVTPSGLLDHTHVRFFTDRSLTAVMASAGFSESARADRIVDRSDQWSSLAPTETRLGSVVRRFRDRVDDFGDVYQFIRLYTPGEPDPQRTPTLVSEPIDAPSCFLSVLPDPSCDAADVEHIRSHLAAQTSTDWELVEVARKESESGLVVARRMLAAARGAYVAIVEPGTQLSPKWVVDFAAARRDGVVLRSQCTSSSESLGGVPELRDLDAPSACFAFPIDVVTGPHVDDLPWATSLYLDLFQFCGVVETGTETVETTAPRMLDPRALDRRVAEIDASAMIVAPGELARRNAELADAERLARHVSVLEADNAWLNAELANPAVTALRKLLRRPRSRT
jgi:SAM-dependent methyltransferase